MKENESNKLLKFIVEKIEDKKGEDIKILDLKALDNSFADYFVICSSNSKIHAQTISNHIVRETRTHLKERPVNIEGEQNAQWILLDYIDVVVHIFQPEYREFYNIESLWGEKFYDTEGLWSKEEKQIDF